MYKVLDALSEASHDVNELLRRDLEVPPVPIETIRRQDNQESSEQDIPSGFRLPKNIVQVFEIWKVFLEQEIDEANELYVILSTDFTVDGYKNGDWGEVKYRGFYLTFEEAKNEINGYLR